MQFDLLIARFPYKGAEHPDTTDWLLKTQAKTLRDPRVGKVIMSKFDDTPITMTRNAALRLAKHHKVDYILMVDSDMSPDLPLEGAKPFWETSLDFALNHRHLPCVVGAPYVGPPPFSNVYVFYWANFMNDCPNPDYKLEQYTRHEAEFQSGIKEVAALPTGLVLIDTRALEFVEPPYFYYEWKDETESEKASTEDVTFTRDLSLAGVPMYCNWDSWAGHWKNYCAIKPVSPQVGQLRQKFSSQVKRELLADTKNGEVMVEPDLTGSYVPH